MRKKDQGFILMTVVCIIALIGIAITIMVNSSRNLAVATKEEKISEEVQNVVKSATIWVMENRKELLDAKDTPTVLNTAEVFKNSTCKITVLEITDEAIEAEIEIQYTIGQIIRKRTTKITAPKPEI
jgi:hypothetical protein